MTSLFPPFNRRTAFRKLPYFYEAGRGPHVRSQGGPSLNLNFVSMTSGEDLARAGVTFSRPSNATLYDSTGKLTYAPNNIYTYSNDASASRWTVDGTTWSSTAGIFPDGTSGQVNRFTLASTGNFYPRPSGTIWSTGTTYILSVWVRSFGSNPNDFRLAAFDGSWKTSSSITLTSEWQRASFSFTAAGSGSGNGGLFYMSGVAGQGVEFAFAQAELVTYQTQPRTYIPTTASAVYGPRFDYDPVTLAAKGLLIEEARTNSIRNSIMVGAVAGTPGTIPTNWIRAAGSGLSWDVAGVGVDNGVPYVDMRLSGTGAGLLSSTVRFEPTGQITASSGQAWTASSFLKLQNGSLTNVSATVLVLGTSTDGININAAPGITSINPLPSGSLVTQRYSAAGTAGASTTNVVSYLQMSTTAGAVDVTVRIGLPGLELGAFMTSPIPTATTSVARSADTASMTGSNFSSWYNQSAGTFIAAASSLGGSFPRIVGFDAFVGSTPFFYNSTTQVGAYNGSAVSSFVTLSTPSSLSSKLGMAYTDGTSLALVASGGSVVDSAIDYNLSSPSILYIGANNATNFLNGWIATISYYNRRLPNAQLQGLTT